MTMVEIPPYLKALLPTTKLRPPSTQGTIERVTLIERLRQSVLTNRFTLISAPAGSGKTTLAADFAQSATDLTIRWLSLDEGDNDLQTLLLAMVLVTLSNGDETLIQTVSQGHLSARQVANVLINHLDQIQTPPFVLVLDDLHLLTDRDIFQFLDYFIERAPIHVHVLATTRYDPPLLLAKLRARGELAELRLNLLRFNREEANKLLNRLLCLSISDKLIGQMVECTEGWIAGLHLLGLSLEKVAIEKREQYITDLAHNDRYVFELLAEEVLAQQPQNIQRFLIETSILDELTSELCVAVTQYGGASTMLHDLHRRNLFLVSVGDGTYRYHALFRDFLQDQLKYTDSDFVKTLHRRAGDAHFLLNRKIHHYLVAEAWDNAVALISVHGRNFMEQGNGNIVAQWLSQLPGELCDHSAWILFLQGTLAYHRGDFENASQILKSAEILFRRQQDAEGIFETLIMQNAVSENDEDVQSTVAYIQLLKPYTVTNGQRLLLELMMAWAYLNDGKRYETVECMLSVLNLVKFTPERLGFVGFQIAAPLAMAFDNPSLFRTRLLEIFQHFNLDTHIFRASGKSILAQIALWQGTIALAQTELAESVAIWKRLGGETEVHAGIQDFLHLILALLRGDDAEVDRITLESRDNPKSGLHLAMKRAQWAWLRGDKAEMRYILDHFEPLEMTVQSPVAGVYRVSLEALLALEAGNFEVIEPTLLHYIQRQNDKRSFYSLYIHDLRVMLAYCYLQIGLDDAALETIRAILKTYAPINIPGRLAQEGAFVIPLMEQAAKHNLHTDFAQQVLALVRSSHEPKAIEIADSGETLTIREVEILKLIVTGASNREIAETLVISENTVKSHITRILGKLHAKSRTEAVSRVRELGIIL